LTQEGAHVEVLGDRQAREDATAFRYQGNAAGSAMAVSRQTRSDVGAVETDTLPRGVHHAQAGPFRLLLLPAPLAPMRQTSSPCGDLEIDAAHGVDASERYLETVDLEQTHAVSSSTPR
jgi:hypothetical protein